MIKIFIPSYNRAGSPVFTTVALLDAVGVECYKVIVRKSQWTDYARCLKKKNLIVLEGNGDLTVAREAARQELRMGEWSLHMDDNVRGFIQPVERFYIQFNQVPLKRGQTMVTRREWQPTMNVEVDFRQFYDLIVEDTLEQCNQSGAYLAGFSAHENPAFRFNKWADVGYVCGKAMLMRKYELPWKQSRESAGEDYALTAAHLFDQGRVVINRWGHPKRVHYQEGGCGPYEQRLGSMQMAQLELTRRYGNLLGIKNANNPEKKQGELRIRFNNREQVEAWRSAFTHDPNFRVRGGKLVMA